MRRLTEFNHSPTAGECCRDSCTCTRGRRRLSPVQLELRDRLAIADANFANATRILPGLRLEEQAGIGPVAECYTLQ